MDTATMDKETQYLSKEVFNMHLQGIKERAESEERITDMRLERLQAIMERNLSEVKSEINAVNERMEKGFALMNERMDKNLAEYKAAASDMKTEISEIRGDVKALNAGVQSLQQRRSWDIAWISLAVAVGIALIQIFSK